MADGPDTGGSLDAGDAEGRRRRYQAAMRMALRQGLATGGLVLLGSSGAAILAHQYWPLFRGITFPGKVMLVTAASVSTGVIAGEQAMHCYSRLASGAPPLLPKRGGRWQEWVLEHRLGLLGASLMGALASGGLWMGRDRRRTGIEKALGLRLYVQAVGLGAVFAIAGLGVASRASKQP